MTKPSDVNAETVRCFAQAGLTRRYGAPAVCAGVLRPRVVVDRIAEGKPGFEALMFHEGTHAFEFHAFVGLLFIGLAFGGVGVSIAFGLWWLLLLFPAGLAGWAWWRREQEIRADVIALWGAGGAEFRAFLLMHRDPPTAFSRWCYGRTLSHREARTHTRLHRMQRDGTP